MANVDSNHLLLLNGIFTEVPINSGVSPQIKFSEITYLISRSTICIQTNAISRDKIYLLLNVPNKTLNVVIKPKERKISTIKLKLILLR
jgi:hypothetical protein